ncbi:hypothetical protein NQ318_009605, partial [Aromia moschata]
MHPEPRYSNPTKDPFPVVQRGDKTFLVRIHGREKHISVDRLKPAYLINDQVDPQNRDPEDNPVIIPPTGRNSSSSPGARTNACSTRSSTHAIRQTCTLSGPVTKPGTLLSIWTVSLRQSIFTVHRFQTGLSRSILQQHMQIHTGKLCKCPQSGCVYTARKMSEIKEHYKIHSDVKNFVCDLCDYKGKTRQQLN